ncbi:sugar ABC transporter ATP-binding protein [uncultured Cohaesibacter sp.]|uniref:sugar ABC transporter ATP-binding protein n=1 Tax=uncultured Cohaesibacter sp. TaxID=1002546 RepID=UPI0029C6046C|nr:sugar ABC transporter ATP-binding protein [uncultured Cohaesibacter sp.]
MADHANITPLVELKGITKTFGGIHALKNAECRIYPGEVVALIGENGAGKSTLVKSMTGLYHPDSGTIRIKGIAVKLATAKAAAVMGITAIHQETTLFEELSVVENIFMGHPCLKSNGLLDWKSMHDKARDLLAEVDLHVDPSIMLKQLSLGQQHMVAIARALAEEADVVIMDEPTSSLSSNEIEKLYVIIERLRKMGKGILFISHKFDEIFHIADRYVVFRDGSFVGEGNIADVQEHDLVKMMVGREVETVFPKREVEVGAPLMVVENLGNGIEFKDISFTLHKREILGFYGLVGAGRSEVMRSVMALSPYPFEGSITLDGKAINWRDCSEAIDAGVVYVPEDRRNQGAILPLSIRDNIALPSLKRLANGIWPDKKAEQKLAQDYGRIFAIRAANIEQPVEDLSGGNQQKVVLSRWLATEPNVVIVDEPTRGIDVGAKSAVHDALGSMVEQDLSVLLVSSELPELMGMADRIIVMRLGEIVAEIDRKDFDAEVIAAYATGAKAPQLRSNEKVA